MQLTCPYRTLASLMTLAPVRPRFRLQGLQSADLRVCMVTLQGDDAVCNKQKDRRRERDSNLFIQGVPGLVDGPSEALSQVMLLEAGCHAHICGVSPCIEQSPKLGHGRG